MSAVRMEVEHALAALAATGPLTPERVVAAAQDTASPLHRYFTWDDSEAARKFRLEEARYLIRSVQVRVTVDRHEVAVPYYVRDPEAAPTVQGYVAVKALKDDAATTAIRAEIDRARSALQRTLGIAALLGVQPEVTRIVDTLAALDALVVERQQVTDGTPREAARIA